MQGGNEMLVLSRNPGERILIGGGIELEVVAVQKGRVKLGIHCPPEIPVLRAELLEQVASGFAAEHEPAGRLMAVCG
jgi:carbon storage regulator